MPQLKKCLANTGHLTQRSDGKNCDRKGTLPFRGARSQRDWHLKKVWRHFPGNDLCGHIFRNQTLPRSLHAFGDRTGSLPRPLFFLLETRSILQEELEQNRPLAADPSLSWHYTRRTRCRTPTSITKHTSFPAWNTLASKLRISFWAMVASLDTCAFSRWRACALSRSLPSVSRASPAQRESSSVVLAANVI